MYEQDVTIDDIKDNFRVINTLISDLTEVITITLDNIKDASATLDEDSHIFEDLDEVAALCDEMNNLVEHAIDKNVEANQIIFRI